MPNLFEVLARTLVTLRWPLLVLAVIAAIVSFGPAQRVAYDRSVENLFSPQNSLIRPYSRLKRAFGGNEVVLAVYPDENLFHPDRSGLDRMRSIRESLSQIAGVKDVLSIDLPIGEKIALPDSELAYKTRQLFAHLTHDAKGQIASVLCMLEPRHSDREKTIEAIRQTMRNLPEGVGSDQGWDIRASIDGLPLRVVVREKKVRVIVAGRDAERIEPASPGQTSDEYGEYRLELDEMEKDLPSRSNETYQLIEPRDIFVNVKPQQVKLEISEYFVRTISPDDESVEEAPARELLLTWDDRKLQVANTDQKSGIQKVIRPLPSSYPNQGVKVVVHLDKENFNVESQSLPEGLKAGFVTGEPAMVVEGFRLLEDDGRRMSIWSTVLLCTVVILCFRSVWWVAIPLAVVQLALLLTKATLVWCGLELSIVSSMLTAIVTVVSVATVVHITIHYREAREQGRSPLDALRFTTSWLIAPIFFACMTDAVGFGSLLAAEVRPVRDFGFMLAIGALYSMVAAAIIVPGFASLADLISSRLGQTIDQPAKWMLSADPQPAWGEGRMEQALYRVVGGGRTFRGAVLLATVLLAVVSVMGVFRLTIETDFTKNFRGENKIVRSYKFVEENLGGVGVFDVLLPAPTPEKLDYPYMRRIRSLEARLMQEVVVENEQGDQVPGLTYALSLCDGVAAGPIDVEGFSSSFLRDRVVREGVEVMRKSIPTFVDALYAKDPDFDGRQLMRVMLRAKERQPAEQKDRLIAQVEKIVDEELHNEDWQSFISQLPDPQKDRTPPRWEATGFFILLTNLIKSMLQDQWAAFGVAAVGIGLMMFLAMLLCDPIWGRRRRLSPQARRRAIMTAPLRSLLFAGIALVPNVLPILIVMGAMGWLGFKINLGAVMISAVSLGLSVDSSIHYMIAFRRRHAEYGDREKALFKTQQGVGRAVIFSTLALIVGFTVLCVSEFVPTIYFGALVSLSMLGGLVGNLVVLPMLLRMVTPQTSNGSQTANSLPPQPSIDAN